MAEAGDEHEPILLPTLPGRGGIQATFTYSRPGEAKHKSCPSPVLQLHAEQPPWQPLSHYQESGVDAAEAPEAAQLRQQMPALSSDGLTSHSHEAAAASSSPPHSSASPAPGHTLSRFHPSHAASPLGKAEAPPAEQRFSSPTRRVRARTVKVDAGYEDPQSSDYGAADSPDVSTCALMLLLHHACCPPALQHLRRASCRHVCRSSYPQCLPGSAAGMPSWPR